MSSHSTSHYRGRILVEVIFKADVLPSVHTERELNILTSAADSILEKSPALLDDPPPPPPPPPCPAPGAGLPWQQGTD